MTNMTATSDLIDALAANLVPVRRLRPPLVRASLWLLYAMIILALVAIGHGVRPDLPQRLHESSFVVAVVASLVTGVLAAVASFMASLPDRPRAWLLLPLPALAVWMTTIGYGCLTDWVRIEPGGVDLGETARCFATLVLTSVPLSLAMFLMLRHVAMLRATALAWTGSLAVAALSATALLLFHAIDASAMILIWNVGSAAVLVTIGAVLGQRMLASAPPWALRR